MGSLIEVKFVERPMAVATSHYLSYLKYGRSVAALEAAVATLIKNY